MIDDSRLEISTTLTVAYYLLYVDLRLHISYSVIAFRWSLSLVVRRCTLTITITGRFDYNGGTPYEHGGLPISINLSHWIKGYQNGRFMNAPACNFVLVHTAMGITLNIMMALSMIKPSWRRKYGKYFFTLAFVMGVHMIPAAIKSKTTLSRESSTFFSVSTVIFALWGFTTLHHYGEDPARAERHLLIQYFGIFLPIWTIIGCGEILITANEMLSRMKTGVWRDYGYTLDSRFGNSVYDQLPESVGRSVFFVWAAIVWLWWPMTLIIIDTEAHRGARVPAKLPTNYVAPKTTCPPKTVLQ